MRIALVDDDEGRLDAWRAALQAVPVDADVVAFGATALPDLVNELKSRQLEQEGATSFDDVDILIADYDLRQSDVGLTTGADIARLVRTYTRCGPIVLLNPYRGANRENRFDLSLVGDMALFSDVEVGSAFIGNPGLWHPENWPILRPWQWPSLTLFIERLKLAEELLTGHEDEPLGEVVPGLKDNFPHLDRDERVWLGPNPLNLTAKVLAAGIDSDLGGVPLGPAGRDRVPESLVARFAAARLIKWIDQFVRTRQIALVDAPHMVMRYPGILSGAADLEALSTLGFPATDVLDAGIVDAAAHLGPWCSRPVWWVAALQTELSAGPPEDVRAQSLKSVFCEDISRFIDTERALDYPLSINSAYRRRWVAGAPFLAEYGPTPDYQPSQWFAL